MDLINLLESRKIEFNESILRFLNEFNSRLALLNEEIYQKDNELSSGLVQIENQFKSKSLELHQKFEYLKAEVWRYKYLLEEFSKADSGPEMLQRVKDLEDAVKDHGAAKYMECERLHNHTRLVFESELTSAIHELRVKVEFLHDELKLRIDGHINTFKSFLDTEFEKSKGTCSIIQLSNLPPCNYANTSSYSRLGDFLLKYETPFGDIQVECPEIISFQDKKHLIVIYDEGHVVDAENISDTFIFRVLLSNLPDKVKLMIFDRDFNEKFREFGVLPKGVVWSGHDVDSLRSSIVDVENEIREKFSIVWSNIDDGNQTIFQYNQKLIQQEKYDDIIPHKLFCVDNFEGMVEKGDFTEIMERISKLTSYGVNFIFLFKALSTPQPKLMELISGLSDTNFHIVDFTSKFKAGKYSETSFSTKNLNNEDKSKILATFNNEWNNIQKDRQKLKFKHNYSTSTTEYFKQNPGSQVKVAFGKALLGDQHEFLRFTSKEGLSNALLCGGVGSGKTNFLKTIITSLSLQYSPEQLELYLIDLKNGAGFSVFQNHQLPHVKIFAFSAENELIHDIFENLRKEMESRYREYSKYNIDNLEDVYKDPNLAPFAPKRIVVIIDEFASLYTEDALFQDEISVNILNIVQKGRGMGINLLLATQNFSNIRNAMFNQAVTQIPVRILLKSSPEAARSILGFSNNGSNEVSRVGEGLINENFGELNSEGGNRFFKSFLLDNEDLVPYLESIRNEVEKNSMDVGPSIFIDSAIEADFSTNFQIKDWLSRTDTVDYFKRHGSPCWLGESFLMNKDSHFSFIWKTNNKSYGQNIAISGNDRENSFHTIFAILSSISYTHAQGSFELKIINPFDEDSSRDFGLSTLFEKLKVVPIEIFNEPDLPRLLSGLTVLLETRKGAKAEANIFVVIPGLERFLQLHSNYSDNPLANQFKQLLDSGSSNGVYFICEINKPTALGKISRDLIGCFEHRISYALNSEESEYFINSKLANQLVNFENPDIRSKAIYYSQTNQFWTKFKAYTNLLEHDDLFLSGQDYVSPLTDLLSYSYTDNSSKPSSGDSPWNLIDLADIPDDATINVNNPSTDGSKSL